MHPLMELLQGSILWFADCNREFFFITNITNLVTNPSGMCPLWVQSLPPHPDLSLRMLCARLVCSTCVFRAMNMYTLSRMQPCHAHSPANCRSQNGLQDLMLRPDIYDWQGKYVPDSVFPWPIELRLTASCWRE